MVKIQEGCDQVCAYCIVPKVRGQERSIPPEEIIAEINDDILAYRTKYGNLLFVVYDLGFIRDVDLFAAHFEESQGVMVRVIKH